MAHPQVGTSVPPKLSFAKIAAMPAPNITPALPSIIRETRPRLTGNVTQHTRSNSQIVQPIGTSNIPKTEPRNQVDELMPAVDTLTLATHDIVTTHVSQNGGSGDSIADDQSQLSGSSLKQQSFDTKSLASVTTFAMDEKESIRPDDSASVRAVDEDDAPPRLSRTSSFQQELEPQTTLSKRNVRMLGPNVTIAARRYPYTTLTNPPRFGDLPVEPVPQTLVQDTHPSNESSTSVSDETQQRAAPESATPDEKLLEALTSPKDRLPLLQLEEKLITFVNTSRDTVLELPPQNSFTRLLSHKLADYYGLAHHINDENNSVRIFRTDYCTLPIPLAEIARSVPVGSQQISYATQVKIMRRVQLGPRQFSAGNSTAASSSVPSKATSENGVETASEEGLLSSGEGTPGKDRSKLTREEREAQYKAARERIFGDFQESGAGEAASPLENGSTGEASANMSRSSSSSGKKKSRKSKVPKDDSFEARSSFIPSYAPMHVQPMYQQLFNEAQYPGNYHPATYSPGAFSSGSSTNYTAYDPNLTYNHHITYGGTNGAAFSPLEGWQGQQTPPGNFFNFQPSQPFQQAHMHSQMNNQYQQALPQPMSQPSNWTSNQPQSIYLQNSQQANNSTWQNYNPGSMHNAMPYQYGQLPAPAHAGGVPFMNQHPVPGSFTGSKSLFNPQTRSFVPNNASARGGARGGRKKGQQPNSARTSGASSPAVSGLNDAVSIRPKEDSLQQKYGTPANLPKKPPPSQVSPHSNSDHNAGGGGGSIVLNGSGKNTVS